MDAPSGFTTTKGASFTLRYSSKELLCEGKNSMMSDVFAFGMLVLGMSVVVLSLGRDELGSPHLMSHTFQR